jgi:hypothetical protein
MVERQSIKFMAPPLCSSSFDHAATVRFATKVSNNVVHILIPAFHKGVDRALVARSDDEKECRAGEPDAGEQGLADKVMKC